MSKIQLKTQVETDLYEALDVLVKEVTGEYLQEDDLMPETLRRALHRAMVALIKATND